MTGLSRGEFRPGDARPLGARTPESRSVQAEAVNDFDIQRDRRRRLRSSAIAERKLTFYNSSCYLQHCRSVIRCSGPFPVIGDVSVAIGPVELILVAVGIADNSCATA